MMYFSLDCESMGLLGPTFSVGWVVVDKQNDEKEEGYLAYPHPLKDVESSDLQWMKENVLPHLPEPNCVDEQDLYKKFWTAWTQAQETYEDLVMVSDVPFPVEANFLLRCLKSLGLGRESSPHPILDVASALATAYEHPNEQHARLPTEEPVHNPVCDARQSVRILLEVQKEISRDRTLAIVHGFYGPVVPDQPSTITFTEAVDGDLEVCTNTSCVTVVEQDDE